MSDLKNDLSSKINSLVDDISKDLSSKIDHYFIEGLKRKGFEFKHKEELISFIKERCRCEDNQITREKIYYVDNQPFFLFNYKEDYLKIPELTDGEFKITATLGHYTYL